VSFLKSLLCSISLHNSHCSQLAFRFSILLQFLLCAVVMSHDIVRVFFLQICVACFDNILTKTVSVIVTVVLSSLHCGV